MCVCDGVCVTVCVCERMSGCGDMQGKVFRLGASFLALTHG